jgi:hypothetical protein
MSSFKLNTSLTQYLSRVVILLPVIALFLISACNIFSPPPTPPPPPPPNQPPLISSLTAEKEASTLSESQIVCEASDTDGDTLTYEWSADGGTIKGEGNSITWVAPVTSDNYTIKVTVTDGKGGTASESTTIAVIEKPNQPPVITKITIDGIPPAQDNRIRQWITKTIKCISQDPDGDKLSYLWRATGGKITGNGDTVGWTSPGVNGDYTVTVVVTDGRGGKAETSTAFKVICCGGGF